jgi:hypothetical protein
MKILVSTRVIEVTAGGLTIGNDDGAGAVEADTVSYAVGQKPLRTEALALSDCASEFYQIGDCLTPKTVYDATSAAHSIVVNIGRS